MATRDEPEGEALDARGIEALVLAQVAKPEIRSRSIHFQADAIQAVVDPALPHLEEVNAALESETITREVLSDSIQTILRNACDIAEERGLHSVGAEVIEASMKRYCPYVFWC